MIGVVEGSMDVALLSALNLVRRHRALILLEHEGYRDSFGDHPKLALLHIDDLLAKVKGDGKDGEGEGEDDSEDDEDDGEDDGDDSEDTEMPH